MDSPNTRVYKCRNCGREFCYLITPSRYEMKFCSKECSSEYWKNNPRLPKKVHKFQTAEQFTDALHKLISEKGRYVTMDEAAHELHVCSNEFKRLGVRIEQVNADMGMTRTVSSAQDKVFHFLKKYIPDIQKEVSFSDLISPKGMVLRYDLGSRNKNLLIELDGCMHQKGHSWYTEYRESCDRMKEQFAKENGCNFMRIPVVKSFLLTDEVMEEVFADIIRDETGNQQPEVVGTSSNGSETDSISRSDVDCGGRNTAKRRDTIANWVMV